MGLHIQSRGSGGVGDFIEVPVAGSIYSEYTSTVISVGQSASTILAANNKRFLASIRLFNTTGTIFLGFHSVPSTVDCGLYLINQEGYEINTTNLFRGTVNAISSTNTSSLALMEWVA